MRSGTMSDLPAGAFQLDVEKTTHPVSAQFHKRAESKASKDVFDTLDNERYYYATDIDVGSPSQRLRLLVDTGSSDLWVFTPQSQISGDRGKPDSYFDPSKSSSYKSNGTSYKIQYGIGQATGRWGTDQFKIGGRTVKSLSFGICDTAQDISQGIVGVGRPQANYCQRWSLL